MINNSEVIMNNIKYIGNKDLSELKTAHNNMLKDIISIEPEMKVIELGTGSGFFWTIRDLNIPDDSTVILSDISEDILYETEANLMNMNHNFSFEKIDAMNIPYPDDYFDIVIANHVLYHVEDIYIALSEIKRILKPGGTFYSSNLGKNNFMELEEIFFKYNADFSEKFNFHKQKFLMDNGREILEKYFSSVDIYRFEDKKEITDFNSLYDYYLFSGYLSEEEIQNKKFYNFLMSYFNKYGKIFITKDSGLFVSVNL